MAETIPAKLLEAIVARICHDLIGPVGAVHNGVELVEESDSSGEAEEMMGMVKDSAKQAWGRLAFFRAAFGSGGGQDGFSGKDIETLLNGGLGTKRLSFTLSGAFADKDYELNLANSRLAFGLAMAAGESLPRGGVVNLIAGGDQDRPKLAAIGEGERAELKDEVVAALAGGAPEPRAAHVHLLLARANTVGRKVDADAEGGRATWQAA